MKQNTRMWIDGNEVEIPEFMCCSMKCDSTVSHSLVYDGNQDGTPDNVTSDGNTITITPADLSVGECDNDVVYALQNAITGVSINSTNAVISIDCGIASQESCNIAILIDTLCDGTVIGTRSMDIVLTCGECDEDEGTQLDYDGDDDGVPDNITSDDTIVTVTPTELQTVGCENGVITYVLNPEETPEGATIDENTAVISIDCQLIATANADCLVTLDVYPRCDGEYIVIDGVEQHTIINVPLSDYCTSECMTQETQLDYDGNNDGVPDTVTIEENIITVTPVDLDTGHCTDPNNIVYSLATAVHGVTIDPATAVITIDCALVDANVCELDLTINTECVEQ